MIDDDELDDDGWVEKKHDEIERLGAILLLVSRELEAIPGASCLDSIIDSCVADTAKELSMVEFFDKSCDEISDLAKLLRGKVEVLIDAIVWNKFKEEKK